MKDSDRYFTSAEIIELALKQWPEGIDLDPCWDPDPGCNVLAKQVYDIRKGENGLLLPWPKGAKVWLNPPYSNPEPWLVKAAQHQGEVLALVNAAISTAYWRTFVWPVTRICCLNPRPKFGKPGTTKTTWNSTDSAVIYYGPERQRFREVWASRGQIVGGLDQSGALYGPSARNLAREP